MEMFELNLKWISSTGGPPILMEEFLISKWNGVNRDDIGFNSLTDYERACEVEGFLGLIDINGNKALVLSGEPMQTSWLSLDDRDGIIIRLNYADSIGQVEESLNAIDLSQGWKDTGITLMNNKGKFVLFDSTFSNEYFEDSLIINLNVGEYRILELLYEPNDEISLVLHRLISKDV